MWNVSNGIICSPTALRLSLQLQINSHSRSLPLSLFIYTYKIFEMNVTSIISLNIRSAWMYYIASAVFIYSINRECMFTLFYVLITIPRYQWVNVVHFGGGLRLNDKITNIFNYINSHWANNNIISTYKVSHAMPLDFKIHQHICSFLCMRLYVCVCVSVHLYMWAQYRFDWIRATT